GGLLGGQDPVSGLTGGQSPVGGLLGGQDPVSGLTGGQSPVGGLLGGQDPVSGLTGGDVVGGLTGRTGLPLADGLPGRVTADIENPLAASGESVDLTGASRADRSAGTPLDGLLGGLGALTDGLPANGLGRAGSPPVGNPLDDLTEGLTDALPLSGVGRADGPVMPNPVEELSNGIQSALSALVGLDSNPLQNLAGNVGNPVDLLTGLNGVGRSDLPTDTPLDALGAVDPVDALTSLPTDGLVNQGRSGLPTGNPLEGLGVENPLDALTGLTNQGRADLPTGNPLEGLGVENPLEGLGVENPINGLTNLGRTGNPLGAALMGPSVLGEVLGLGGLPGGIPGGLQQRSDLPVSAPVDGLNTQVSNPADDVTELLGLDGGLLPTDGLLDGLTGEGSPLGDLGDLLALPGAPAGRANTPPVADPLGVTAVTDLLGGDALGALTGGLGRADRNADPVGGLLDETSPLGDLAGLLGLGRTGFPLVDGALAGAAGGSGRADLPSIDNPLDGIAGEPLAGLDELVDVNGLTGRHPVSGALPATAEAVRPVEETINLFEAVDNVTQVAGVTGAAPRSGGGLGLFQGDPQQLMDAQQYPDSLAGGFEFALAQMTGNGVDLKRTPVAGLVGPEQRSSDPMATLVNGIATAATMGVMSDPLATTDSLDGASVGGDQLSEMTLTLPRFDDTMTDVLYVLGAQGGPMDEFTKDLHLNQVPGADGLAVMGPDPLADTAVLAGPRSLDNLEGAFSGHLVQLPPADHLPVRTPALPGLDGRSDLQTAAGSSLADTRSRLTKLVGGNPIG
ncbi:hypothetical protein ACWEPX_08770, partial [Actinokineospora sp. NPDC004072]